MQKSVGSSLIFLTDFVEQNRERNTDDTDAMDLHGFIFLIRLIRVIRVPLYSSRRPGLLCFVLSTDCSCLHSSIFLWSPLINMSGTFQPRKSSGLVYTG